MDLVYVCQEVVYLKAKSNELEQGVRTRILKTSVQTWMNLRKVTDLEKT